MSAEVGQSAGPIALVLANSLAMLLRAALGRMHRGKTRGKQVEKEVPSGSFQDFELNWCPDNRMHLRLPSFAAFVDGVILTYPVHLYMKTYIARQAEQSSWNSFAFSAEGMSYIASASDTNILNMMESKLLTDMIFRGRLRLGPVGQLFCLLALGSRVTAMFGSQRFV